MLDLKEFKILVALEEQRCKSLTQREIASASGLSVGTVNRVMPLLRERGLVRDRCLLIVGWKHSILTVLKGGAGCGWVRVSFGPYYAQHPKPLIQGAWATHHRLPA
ncbi:MAG: winged helix-turn-helix domain-containing protein [Eggerthellaceae bacterium]